MRGEDAHARHLEGGLLTDLLIDLQKFLLEMGAGLSQLR